VTSFVQALRNEIRHKPLLWLLAFVPIVFVAAKFKHEAHTLLFVLSVLAIVPLAALLSHATESVAAKTGDAVGGLLNATLGNLTELVIALTALRAGEYMLVKASLAGAIVTNTLFMLGTCFLLGGLKYHVQEYNRAGARLQAGLLFLATVALLVPSAVAQADSAGGAQVHAGLSVGLSVLLIAAYGLGMLFSLKTHRELFAGAEHGEDGEDAVAHGHAPRHAGRRHRAGGAGERDLRRVGAEGGGDVRDDARVRGLHRRGAGGRRGGDGLGVFRRAQEPAST
jgi:Ca2+:H+ antiporter